MQIRVASVMVENQNTALHFYTTILGFVKSKDIPMGPTFRWLTVSAPEGAEGVELLLEPIGFLPAQTYQKALFNAGIPATAFITNDIQSEYRRPLRRHLRQPHQSSPTRGLTAHLPLTSAARRTSLKRAKVVLQQEV
jgi:catechol 2,3-dioxygenase-like lactoylglutathione lyase family enzyme